MLNEMISLLNLLGDATHLPVHLFINGIYHASARHADGTESDSPFLHDMNLIGQLRQEAAESSTLMADSDYHMFYYGLLCPEENIRFVLGPYATYPVSEETRYSYMTRHGMADFGNYQIPIVQHRQIKSAMQLALRCIGNEAGEIKELLPAISENPHYSLDEPSLLSALLRNTEEGFHHHSYFLEKEILNCIHTCNEESLVKFLSSGIMSNSGKMDKSAEKQSEYAAVLAITFFVRAAIEEHVDPYRAYALNDHFLQQISQTRSPQRHLEIILSAVHQLIGEIRRIRSRQRSLPHVERAKQYIHTNLNRKLTLPEISREIGVSPSYLSAVFKKHEGMTVSAYILQQKVNAAETMLIYSRESVANIAAYLNFSSHSHLSAAFRAQHGMTPSEFRNQNQIVQ